MYRFSPGIFSLQLILAKVYHHAIASLRMYLSKYVLYVNWVPRNFLSSYPSKDVPCANMIVSLRSASEQMCVICQLSPDIFSSHLILRTLSEGVMYPCTHVIASLHSASEQMFVD